MVDNVVISHCAAVFTFAVSPLLIGKLFDFLMLRRVPHLLKRHLIQISYAELFPVNLDNIRIYFSVRADVRNHAELVRPAVIHKLREFPVIEYGFQVCKVFVASLALFNFFFQICLFLFCQSLSVVFIVPDNLK